MKKPLAGAELNELVAGLNKLSRNLWWSWQPNVIALFRERGIVCERVGRVDRSLQLRLAAGDRDAPLWDLAREPFTGFGPRRPG